MSGITYAYRMHPHMNKVQHVAIGLEELPRLLREGWYDSPSKVPGAPEYVRDVAPLSYSPEPPMTPASHGEKPLRRGPGRPPKSSAA